MADDLEFSLEVNTGGSAGQVKALASALSGLAGDLRDVGGAINRIANNAEKVEKGLLGIGTGAKKASSELATLKAAQNALSNTPGGQATQFARTQRDAIHPGLAASEFARAHAQALGLVADEKKITEELRGQLTLRRAAVEEARKARMGNAYTPSQTGGRGQAMLPALPAGGSAFREAEAGAKAAASATLALQAANIASAKATMDHMNRLTNLRYTLYDVQRSFLVAGLAIGGFSIITIKAAMDYETAMAQISRTSGIAGTALENVRSEFIDLAQSIPTSFADLSQIGTLGGQLNIPAENLANFTKTVAQFTTTTNVAVDQAATAFGRLDALLPDVQGNYEALGSSILNVGINSVATETEIINTTNQIAAAGQQAGLSASQIIGLASAYASLGVAPEAARGTTIRFFSEIGTAIAEGGDNLQKFADLSGKTTEQFKTDWGQDAGQAFLELLDGMKGVAAEGGNVESVLRSMGITAVRDINALLKLSQNAEIVADQFGYAAEGFDEATQLGAAFEVQAATLASKIQVLVNTLQAFFAELGSGGIPVLGLIVDGLSSFIGFLTDLASIPAVQYTVALVGGFTALAAVMSLTGFALARVTSASIAFRTAIATMKYEALSASGGVTTLAASARGLTGALYGAITASKIFKGALISTGIGAAFVAAGFAIEGIVNAVNDLKPAAERAKEAFGDLSTVTDALEADTKAVADGAQSFGTITGEVERTKEETAAWAAELNRATGQQTNLDGAIVSTTSSIGEQTFQIGENTKALTAQALATDETLAKFLIFAQKTKEGTGVGFDTKGFITALTENDIRTATALIDQYQATLQSKLNAQGSSVVVGGIDEVIPKFDELRGMVELYEGRIQAAATQTEIYNAVMEASGTSAERLAQATGVLADEAQATTDTLSVLRDTIANAFGEQNLISQMSQDFYNLASSVYEGGNAFDTFSQQGITNLNNFQQSIGTVIAAGQTMGLSATQSVAALFSQLQAMGIDTANLLASLANIPGISVAGVSKAMGNLSPKATNLTKALSGVASQAKAAGAALGGGGGGGGGSPSTAGGAGAAAKAVRTLLDYASDLRGVFSRSFDIRFGSDKAMDTITTGWQGIAKSSKEALQNIASLQAKLSQLASDKSINEYFKSIAEGYGDTLRSADINADLEDINAQMAETQGKLTEEQDKTNKSLVGNTAASIENRKTITGLVQNYHDLIEQYASSGMSQEELMQKTAELKNEFMIQATQLGYNSEELQKYAVSFDDVALAISKVPRNITVTANVNPAIQALNEFEARAIQAGANAGNAVRSGGGGGYNIPMPTMPDLYPLGADAARRWKIGWNSATQSYQTRDAETGAWIRTSMNIYKTGGFTGEGSKDGIAGLVHGKEFVVNAENTAKFRPMLEAMNKGQMPVMQGAGINTGIQVVELSARDRVLLAAAGNVSLSIDGRTVADAANTANFVSAKRGSS